MVNLKKKTHKSIDLKNNKQQHDLDAEAMTCTDVENNLKPKIAAKVFFNPLSGLTEQQCSEHYDNCIKLAVSNKINQHNAFQLHLIDHINGLVNRGEVSSFQIASSSLDAGAKIYASRVDALHSGTFKVLDGLTGKLLKQKENLDGVEQNTSTHDDCDLLNSSVTKNKRRQRASRCLITTSCLNKIRLKASALRFDFDPMFEKLATVYDKDLSDHLRLNKTPIRADDCDLQLDSSANVVLCATALQETHTSRLCLTPNLRRQIHNVYLQWDNLQLCDTFSNFLFSDRKDSFSHEQHVTEQFSMMEEELDDFEVDSGCCEMRLACSSTTSVDNTNTNMDSIGINTKSEQRNSCRFVSDLRGFMSELLVDSQRQDNCNLLDLWAGPELWKRKLVNSRELVSTELQHVDAMSSKTAVHVKSPSSRKGVCKRQSNRSLVKKKGFKIAEHTKLGLQLQWRHDFAVKRAKLSNAAVERQLMQNHLIMPQVESGVQLFNLMNKDADVVLNNMPGLINDDVDDINFNNCEGDDHELSNAFDRLSPLSSVDTFFDTVDLNSHASVELENANKKRPSNFNLNYVRKAKSIDVREIKTKMWSHLCMLDDSSQVGQSKSTSSSVRFQHLLRIFATSHVDDVQEDDLSVAVLFSCLLHLANEKKLHLEGVDHHTDVTITQNTPPRCDAQMLSNNKKRSISTSSACSASYFAVKRAKMNNIPTRNQTEKRII